MHTLILQGKGSKDQAPQFMAGNWTIPTWSGRRAETLTEQEEKDMLAYAEDDGWRTGWWGGHPLGDDDGENPFAKEYLDGRPYATWELARERGQRESMEGRDTKRSATTERIATLI